MCANFFGPIEVSLHLSLIFLPCKDFSLVVFLIRVLFWQYRFGRLVRLLPKEGRLESEGVHDVEFSENDHSCRRFFALFDPEAAVSELEVIRRLVTAEERHHANLSVLDPALMFVVLIGASVKKRVLLPGVPVQVTVHQHSPLVMHMSHEVLGVEDGRVQEYVGADPASIKVDAEKGAPLVAEYHSIYIEHGDDPEHEVAPQICRLI